MNRPLRGDFATTRLPTPQRTGRPTSVQPDCHQPEGRVQPDGGTAEVDALRPRRCAQLTRSGRTSFAPPLHASWLQGMDGSRLPLPSREASNNRESAVTACSDFNKDNRRSVIRLVGKVVFDVLSHAHGQVVEVDNQLH